MGEKIKWDESSRKERPGESVSVPKWVMEVTCEKLVRNILHGRTEVTLVLRE